MPSLTKITIPFWAARTGTPFFKSCMVEIAISVPLLPSYVISPFL